MQVKPKNNSSSLVITIIIISTLIKILLIPSYRSTDFEVHRNWLAITNSLPLNLWYYENTSEWTLDYPPFFAYFEFVLSQPAKYIDSQMLNVTNLNYASDATVIYQRLTVIFTELTLVIALYKFLNILNDNSKEVKSENSVFNVKTFLTLQFLFNFGLMLVDNIHFQYNGFLFGIQLLSVYFLTNNNWHLGALLFSSLINFKHIFLYVAPAYFIYILKYYCFQNGFKIVENFSRLFKIGVLTLIPFILSFGPFIYLVISRLFPFKRGLCHAYWAPNFWCIYNVADKCTAFAVKKLKLSSIEIKESRMTSGLIQDTVHQVLPQISPLITFILSSIFMFIPLIALMYKYHNKNYSKQQILLISIIICAYSSFLFGWHVHEKAILMILLPFSLLAAQNGKYSKIYFMLSTIGNFSLFPLLFRYQEYPLKVILWSLFSIYNYYSLKTQHKSLFQLNIFEKLIIFGIIPIEIYNQIIHYLLQFDERLPYLPLLITSIYSSIFVAFYWLNFFYLTFSNDQVKVEVEKKKLK